MFIVDHLNKFAYGAQSPQNVALHTIISPSQTGSLPACYCTSVKLTYECCNVYVLSEHNRKNIRFSN